MLLMHGANMKIVGGFNNMLAAKSKDKSQNKLRENYCQNKLRLTGGITW